MEQPRRDWSAAYWGLLGFSLATSAMQVLLGYRAISMAHEVATERAAMMPALTVTYFDLGPRSLVLAGVAAAILGLCLLPLRHRAIATVALIVAQVAVGVFLAGRPGGPSGFRNSGKPSRRLNMRSRSCRRASSRWRMVSRLSPRFVSRCSRGRERTPSS